MSVTRTLVIAPSWIGDCLMAQPLLTRLKAQHPDTPIDVLAQPWVAPLFARMAEVDTVIDSPLRHGGLQWHERKQLGRQLAGKGYSTAYVLPNSWKSALIPFFAGIPKRIGYHGEARYLLLNTRHKLNEQQHPQLVQRYAALAGPLDPSVALQASLQSTTAQQAAVRSKFGIPASPVIFCPGAEFGPAKRWPAHHFAALAKHYGTPENPVLLIGSPKDAAVGSAIAEAAAGHARNLCGTTQLEEAIDLLAQARLVASNDSGLMHVAAALGRPQIAFFGSSSPDYTPPMNPRARIVSLNLNCSPCFKRECPLGHLNCLNNITPDAATQAADAVI